MQVIDPDLMLSTMVARGEQSCQATAESTQTLVCGIRAHHADKLCELHARASRHSKRIVSHRAANVSIAKYARTIHDLCGAALCANSVLVMDGALQLARAAVEGVIQKGPERLECPTPYAEYTWAVDVDACHTWINKMMKALRYVQNRICCNLSSTKSILSIDKTNKK